MFCIFLTIIGDGDELPKSNELTPILFSSPLKAIIPPRTIFLFSRELFLGQQSNFNFWMGIVNF